MTDKITPKETEKQEQWVYTLILDNGKEIEITMPDEIGEEVGEDMRNALRQGIAWDCGNWMDLRATFEGARLESINMARVIGWR